MKAPFIQVGEAWAFVRSPSLSELQHAIALLVTLTLILGRNPDQVPIVEYGH